jgi:hypothetical protein
MFHARWIVKKTGNKQLLKQVESQAKEIFEKQARD